MYRVLNKKSALLRHSDSVTGTELKPSSPDYCFLFLLILEVIADVGHTFIHRPQRIHSI